jgi:asparagine synthase (glutamine-hydrolysing)
MCGIAGFWGPPDRALLEAMNRIVGHRGPDDEGFFEAEAASIGYRRLAIIDLKHGQQPMGNEDGRIQVVYNGEIYNYRELRAELIARGHTFYTDADTEIIAHAYEEYGPQCFARFNGMWGLAILDMRAERPKLILARDHFGIKPLYWAKSGDRLLFASEIKSILQDRAFVPQPNDQRIYEYLVWGLHDHDAETFFQGVKLVPAATYAVIDESGFAEHAYWQPQLSSDGTADLGTFRDLLKKSVERRLVADVPVGTCLSGGLDSSSIVCFMSELLKEHVPDSVSMGDRLKTFSAVFDGDPIDERAYIEHVLAVTGAEKHYIHPNSERFLEELDEFVWHQDEPIVSTGPYAQWCVMREAAKHVKVLLDGQGGDELLAGYVPYQYVYLRQLLRERRFNTFLREAWAARDVLLPLLRQRIGERRKALHIHRLLKPQFLKEVQAPQDKRSQDNLKLRLLQDLMMYSLPSLLRYEDRNSMAHSIESRVPFLDQELVEWVLKLPPETIIHRGWSRAILREGLKGVLPEKIRLRRWKVGFTTPEMRWLKARRAVIQSLFRSPAFCNRKYWNGLAVADAFRAACNGEVEESLFFWRALNVELWLRVFIDNGGGARNGQFPEWSFVRVGDEAAAQLAGTVAASEALDTFRPNWGRHIFALSGDGQAIYARAAVRTRLVRPGDDLKAVVHEALSSSDGQVKLRPGDILAISEKIVAISQKRSFPVEEIRPSLLATLLSRAVKRTPSGIGLGIPATMHLAIQEVGARRILFAALVSALTRPFGVRGAFYRVAGPQVAAIDGPTAGTIPPYNTHAKQAPLEPARVANDLAQSLRALAGGAVKVAIIDANDIGVQVLGKSEQLDAERLVSLLRDNPLDQGSQQTPIALIRKVSG